MKQNLIKAMSLSILLASPVTFTLNALAEPLPQVQQVQVDQRPGFTVAQEDRQQKEWSAYANSDYDYWDAKVLSQFWGQDVSEAKARIGRKLLWGGESKAYLDQQLVDARVKALGNVEGLSLYSESGYGYDDAAALAKLWGDASPYDSKLRIERNLILGNSGVVEGAVRLARQR